MTVGRIRVLVVDDSAFARKVVREVLSRDPGIEVVGFARDGLDALEKIAELRPDVVTLDLLMPNLDGVGLLRALPKEGAPKVIVVSVSGSDTDIAIEALQSGAVDIVSKPTPLPTDRLYELSTELVSKVKAVAASTPRIVDLNARKAAQLLPKNRSRPTRTRLVVIGTSTGGPQALTQFFKQMPADLPVSFAIALHIPAGYTAPMAARLSLISGVKIEEAYDGMEILRGRGVIAPGGMHLKIRESGGRLFAVVTLEPMDTAHHPSVNVLFESASELGKSVLGVILSGMGDDGMLGCQSIRDKGGRILAESASSCVVYGMPRSVIEAGTANAQAPIEEMPDLVLHAIFEKA